MLNIVTRVEAVAASAHDGQVDKVGRDYIDHPRRIAGNAAVIARRTGSGTTDIEVADEAVDAVIAVAKRAGEPVEDYYTGVRKNRLPVVVKTADLADNTDPDRQVLLDDATPERLAEKYRRSYDLLGIGPDIRD